MRFVQIKTWKFYDSEFLKSVPHEFNWFYSTDFLSVFGIALYDIITNTNSPIPHTYDTVSGLLL